MYKSTFRLISIVIFSIFLFTCSTDESLIGTKPTDAYFYIGYDSTGMKINQGWIKYEFIDSIRVKGEWHLESLSYIENIGDQIGHGELSGAVYSDTVGLNLNPQYKDRNVYLIGIKREDVLKGVWQWITFPGLTNWGTFKAEK